MATRNERVLLELEDRFTTQMARAAAATAVLNHELESLSGEAVRTRRSSSDIDSSMNKIGTSARRNGSEIDKLSGRVRILADAAAVLAPALLPIGAVAVPAIAGLSAQLTFAAVAAGVTVLAFQGIGDTLKAVNKAALEPTQANVDAATAALEKLTPQARGFVNEIGDLIPRLQDLKDTAAGGFFPGATAGLEALEVALPKIQSIVGNVALKLGEITREAGQSLATDRWEPFLDFAAREAPEALGQMAEATGNVAHAFASLLIAFDPLSDDFGAWLVDSTADIDKWAEGLADTQGFADFLAYIDSTGPIVADTLGSIANAAIQILEAAAPLGGPALQGIAALADVVAAVANSDLGTPIFIAVAALALLNRTIAITQGLQRATFGGPAIAAIGNLSAKIRGLAADISLVSRESKLVTLPGKDFIGPLTQAQTALGRVRNSARELAKTGALIGAIGVQATGAADGIGLTNTASLALAGTFISPGWGTAIGGAIGGVIDLANASDGLEESLHKMNAAAKAGDFKELETATDNVKKKLDDLTHQDGVKDFFGDLATQFGENLSHPRDFLPDFAGGTSAVQRIKEDLETSEIDAELSKAAAAAQLFNDGLIATKFGAKDAARSTDDFLKSVEDLNATLSGRSALRDYEQALDDFTDRQKRRADVLADIADASRDLGQVDVEERRRLAAADNKGDRAQIREQAEEQRRNIRQRIADLREQAEVLKNSLNNDLEAGRDTEELLDRIATSGLKVATGLSGKDRTEFLEGVRSSFIDTAKLAGHTQEEAEKLAEELLGARRLAGDIRIVIKPGGGFEVIDRVAERLKRLQLLSELVINLRAIDIHRSEGGRDGDPNTPYWSGGFTGRGGKYEPAGIVHRGEYVFSAEATSRMGVSTLDLVHRKMRGYADGGLVAPLRGSSSSASYQLAAAGPQIDYDRLLVAMLAARPMYGDVRVIDGYGGFKRTMEADRRRLAMGGARS